MTAKWRIAATLNSRAREASRLARQDRLAGEAYVSARSMLDGKSAAYKDAARYVAENMPLVRVPKPVEWEDYDDD